MTLLGTGLFLANSFQNLTGYNAAPSIPPVTLNFDLVANAAPTGANVTLEYEVTASS